MYAAPDSDILLRVLRVGGSVVMLPGTASAETHAGRYLQRNAASWKYKNSVILPKLHEGSCCLKDLCVLFPLKKTLPFRWLICISLLLPDFGMEQILEGNIRDVHDRWEGRLCR